MILGLVFIVMYNLNSFDFENGEKDNFLNLVTPPSVGLSIEKTSNEDDGEFDPTLPTTPPPESVNIPRTSADIKKGIDIDLDKGFDITNINQIKYLDIVIKNSKEQGFDIELALAIIKKESNFNPKAKSSVGAVGLMQLLPETARWLGLKDTSKLTNPDVNIKYGIKYMRYLFSQFAPGFDYENISKEDISKKEVKKVIAAYNAGPGNVRKYDKPPYEGIPPFKETKIYVQKVPFYFIKFKDLSIKR